MKPSSWVLITWQGDRKGSEARPWGSPRVQKPGSAHKEHHFNLLPTPQNKFKLKHLTENENANVSLNSWTLLCFVKQEQQTKWQLANCHKVKIWECYLLTTEKRGRCRQLACACTLAVSPESGPPLPFPFALARACIFLGQLCFLWSKSNWLFEHTLNTLSSGSSSSCQWITQSPWAIMIETWQSQ